MKNKYIFTYIILIIFSFKLSAKDIPSGVLTDSTNYKALAESLLDSSWAKRTKSSMVALNLSKEALKIIDKHEISSLKSKALNFIGVIERKIGNLESAYQYFTKAYYVAKKLNDSTQIGYTYTNFTDYYIQKASYSLALENVLMAYNIFEKLRNKRGISYCLNYMGEIYLRYQMYDKAELYLNDALKLRKEINDQRGYSNALINLGFVYFYEGEFEKAKRNCLEAIRLNKNIKYANGNSIALSLIADINSAQALYTKAEHNLSEALKIDRKINNRTGMIVNLNKLGNIYLKMGKFTKAKSFIKNALKLAHQYGYLEQEMTSYQLLSDYFKSTKKFQSALDAKGRYIVLKDSIYSYENIGRFADLQTLFETNKKDAENKILKQQIEFENLTNNYIFVLMAFALIFVIVFIALLISKNRAQNRANAYLKELNDSKDKFFSIIAHDLKSPFQGLLGYTDILKNEFDDLTTEELRESINSLYNITRNVYGLLGELLEWTRVQSGRIEFDPLPFNLYEEVEKIINLNEKNASKKNIELHSKVNNPTMVFADRNMVNTILRNLVTNAIKFSNSNSSVDIIAEQKDRFIQVTIEDQGVGLTEKELSELFRIDVHHSTIGTAGEEGTGVGLILCKELVETNKGKIWAESIKGKGSKFIFTLPIPEK